MKTLVFECCLFSRSLTEISSPTHSRTADAITSGSGRLFFRSVPGKARVVGSVSPYILKARIVGFKIPQKKVELSANFPQFFLLRTRKISHTDLIGLAWISHTAHRTQRVHIGKNISVIFSMINMEV